MSWMGETVDGIGPISLQAGGCAYCLERISVGLKGLDFFVNATIALIKGGAHGTINQR